LIEFDRSWHIGRLAEEMQRLPPTGSATREWMLMELIKVDLEHQWSSGHQATVESYLAAIPQLGTAQNVSAELLQAEYEVRLQFGARADLADFQARFPAQIDELQQRLRRKREIISDSELAQPARETASIQLDPTPSMSVIAVRSLQLPEVFGRYRILRMLARGGMGEVYLAHDTELDRDVALKVPQFQTDRSPDVLERFKREARSAAMLLHPNICPILDVGEIGGIHYLTMAYVEGISLADVARREPPISQREVAILIHKLALTLQEAHAQGVVHRDLKPSNIMINRRGEPIVMDFGLAWLTDAGRPGEERLTQTGLALGTPAYMSPEQVKGARDSVGASCDIYSLGVILFELLTGKLPFQGSVRTVLANVLTEEPVSPSTIRAGIDPELEGICLKAMAKSPDNRYASMSELADALARYLSSQVEPSRRLPRWPWAVAASAIATTVLAAVFYIATNFGTIKIEISDPAADVQVKVDGDTVELTGIDGSLRLRAREHLLEITGNDFVTVSKLFRVRRGPNEPLSIELIPKQSGLVDNDAKPISGLPTRAGVKSTAESSTDGSAALAIIVGEIGRGVAADPADHRNDELRHQLIAHQYQLYGTAGATAAAELMSRLPWPADALSRDRIDPGQLALAGNGMSQFAPTNLVAVLGDGRMKHWDWVLSVDFSPDDQLLVTASYDHTVRVWNTTTGDQVHVLRGHTAKVASAVFSPDGEMIASAGADHTVMLWDATTGQLMKTWKDPSDRIRQIAFSPDGLTLAAGCSDGVVRRWNIDTKQELPPLRGPRTAIETLSFNRNGKRLATAGLDGIVRVWDPETAKQLFSLNAHGPAYCVLFSPVADMLVSASVSGFVDVWDVANGEPASTFRTISDPGGVRWAVFSKDGETLYTVDRLVKSWHLTTEREPTELTQLTSSATCLAISHDELTLAAGCMNNEIRLLDLDSAKDKPLADVHSHRALVSAVSISRDGKSIVSASADGSVRSWDSATGRILGLPFWPHGDNHTGVKDVSLFPDGKTLVASLRATRTSVAVWDCQALRFVRYFSGFWSNTVAISPDGRWIACGNAPAAYGRRSRTLMVWDSTWKPITEFTPPQRSVGCVAFSSDSELLAAASDDGKIYVWNLSNREIRHTLPISNSLARSVTFSPDGGLLAAGGDDGLVRVWNNRSGSVLYVLSGHSAAACGVAFSPDSRILASAADDGRVHLWDAQSGTLRERGRIQIGPYGGAICDVAFTPDGRHLVTANANGTLYVLRLREFRESHEHIPSTHSDNG
jgi:WD40 repeat protein/serine/threonine protein kinase